MRKHLLFAAASYYSVISNHLGVNHFYAHAARDTVTSACEPGRTLRSITEACEALHQLHEHVIKLPKASAA